MSLHGSPWQDLSEELRSVRKTLENLIIRYAVKKEKGLRTHIIVAPYGSGKTTLLKHLELFSWNKGVPAVRVNLSEIVKHITERTEKKISESILSRFFESFFEHKVEHVSIPGISNEVKEKIINNYKNNRVKGVLLIDEIEEEYNRLKEIILAETTIFRGVFDDVCEGKLRVLPILAFGPSSIFMEAVSLAGGWRTITLSIPLIEPKCVKNLLKNKLRMKNEFLVKALSNMVWWAGKGRYGWVSKLIEAGIPEAVISTLSKIENDKEYLDSIDYLVKEELMDNLRQEIIRGVPLLDEGRYREYLRKLKGEEINLFKILSFLVTPVPGSLLSKYINVDKIRSVKLNEKIFVRSSKALDKATLIKSIIEESKHIIEDHGDLLSLEHIIEMVLSSWSDETESLVIVPVTSMGTLNVEPIERLLDLAVNIALETYKPDVIDVIEKLSIKDIISERALIDLEEKRYILNPQALFNIYPPTMINPLIACSKGAESLEISLGRGYFNVIERFKKFIRENYGVEEGLYFLITQEVKENKELFLKLKEQILGKLMNLKRTPILIPIASSGKDLESLLNFLHEGLKNYDKLRLVLISREIGPKLSLFLLGLLYSFHKCPAELKRAKEQPIEKYLVRQYLRALIRLIEEMESKWYRESENVLKEISSKLKELESISKGLSRDKGRTLGSKQAVYFWITPLCNKKVEELLKNAIEKLADLRNDFNNLLNDINLVDIYKDFNPEKLLDKLYKDISLLTQKKQALKYLENSAKLANGISNLIGESEYVKSLVGIFKEVFEYKRLHDEEIQGKTLYDILNDNIQGSKKVIENIVLSVEEPVAYMFSSIAIRSSLYDVFKETELPTRLRIEINKNIGMLEDFRKSIEELLGTSLCEVVIKNADVEKIKILKKINEQAAEVIKKLDDLRKIVNEASKYILSAELNIFDRLVILEFILESIVKVFSKNLDEVKIFNKLKDVIDSVKAEIEKIDDKVKELKEKYGDVIGMLSIDVSNAVIEDVKYIMDKEDISKWKDGLEKCSKELEKLAETLRGHQSIIEKMKKLKEEIKELNMLMG